MKHCQYLDGRPWRIGTRTMKNVAMISNQLAEILWKSPVFFSRDIYKNDWDLLFHNHMFACMSAHHRRVEHPQDILWLWFFLPIGLLPLVFELPMLDTLLITWNLKHPSINGCCSWMTPNNYCTMVQIYVKALVRPFPTEKCCDSASPLLLVYWECPFSGLGWWTPAGECRENPASA